MKEITINTGATKGESTADKAKIQSLEEVIR
jgi:hypothetical protein